MAESKRNAQNKAPDKKSGRRKGQGRAAVPARKAPSLPPAQAGRKEIGGRKGPDPTRYGDWEQKGRCIDF